jgi:hypothetical protein
MSICAGWRRHGSVWSMCSHLVHLAKTPVLTIDNMPLDLLRCWSFVPSWHRATQLSYSRTQTGGQKIMDGVDISIYMPESWRGWSHSKFESSFTLMFTMWTYLRKGDWCRPSHSLLHHWLEFCDEISTKPTAGGGDPTDRAHDGEIGTHSGDVAFLRWLTDQHRQQPL